MKPLLVQLVPVVLALSMWLLLRREPPPLYSHPLSTGIVVRSCLNVSSGVKRPDSFGLFFKADLQPSDGLCGPTLHPFQSSSVVTWGDQNWAQYCRVAWRALSETLNSFVFKNDCL